MNWGVVLTSVNQNAAFFKVRVPFRANARLTPKTTSAYQSLMSLDKALSVTHFKQ